MTGLVERLRSGDSCPFCGRDPFHYVDIGVGHEAVAVTCCDMGIGLFQHGDEQLREIVAKFNEAADRIEALEAAVKPFAAMADEYDFEPEETQDRVSIAHSHNSNGPSVRITIGDLRRARAALTTERELTGEG